MWWMLKLETNNCWYNTQSGIIQDYIKCIFLFVFQNQGTIRSQNRDYFLNSRFSLRKPGSRKNVPMMTDDELTTASIQCIYTNAPSSNLGASHVTGSFYPVSSSSLRRRSYLIAIDQNKSNELLERSVKPSGVMYTVDDDDMEPIVNPSGFIYTAETASNRFEARQDEIVPISSEQQSSDETEDRLMVRRNIEQIVRKRRSSGKLKRGPIQEMPTISEEDTDSGKSLTPFKGVNNPHVNAKKRPPFFARFRSNAKHRSTVSHHPCFKPNELRSIQQMSQLVSKRIRKMSQLVSNELDDGSYDGLDPGQPRRFGQHEWCELNYQHTARGNVPISKWQSFDIGQTLDYIVEDLIYLAMKLLYHVYQNNLWWEIIFILLFIVNKICQQIKDNIVWWFCLIRRKAIGPFL